MLRRSTAFGHQTIALMFRLRDPPKRDSEANLRCRPWVKPLGRTSASAECRLGPGGQSVDQAAQFWGLGRACRSLVPAPPPGRRAEGRLRRPRSSEYSEMLIHPACLLLRREVLDALAKLIEGRWRSGGLRRRRMLRRRWRIDGLRRRWRSGVLRRRWRSDRLLGHRRASRFDYRRFPPARFLNEFVNDSQERRATCKQAEEQIQVGILPGHVRLPLDSRRQRAAKGSADP